MVHQMIIIVCENCLHEIKFIDKGNYTALAQYKDFFKGNPIYKKHRSGKDYYPACRSCGMLVYRPESLESIIEVKLID